MAKKKEKPRDNVNYYHVYLNIPESEYLAIKATAQKMGCNEVNEYLRKLLALGEVTANSIANGWEMAAFDRSKTKLIENEQTGGVAMLFNGQKDVAILTEEVKKLLDIDKKIENSTAVFGRQTKVFRA